MNELERTALNEILRTVTYTVTFTSALLQLPYFAFINIIASPIVFILLYQI
jgi:hypothetical protein